MKLIPPQSRLKHSLARYVVPSTAVLLLALQTVTCSRTNPAIVAQAPVSPEVSGLLRKACFDCHSNESVWPWYSRVAPVSWLVWSDVAEGRQHLNFSEWPSEPAKQRKHLKSIRDEIQGGDMPLWFYLPLHSAARLSSTEKQTILDWAKQTENKL